VDIDEGAYGVDFVPTEGPGKYKINVRRNGKHIPNSPFILDLGEKKLPSTKLAFTARRKDGSPINDATRTHSRLRFLACCPWQQPRLTWGVLVAMQRRTSARRCADRMTWHWRRRSSTTARPPSASSSSPTVRHARRRSCSTTVC
jgi:hypothetical protein